MMGGHDGGYDAGDVMTGYDEGIRCGGCDPPCRPARPHAPAREGARGSAGVRAAAAGPGRADGAVQVTTFGSDFGSRASRCGIHHHASITAQSMGMVMRQTSVSPAPLEARGGGCLPTGVVSATCAVRSEGTAAIRVCGSHGVDPGGMDGLGRVAGPSESLRLPAVPVTAARCC
jgi:hypothetical protein